MDLAPAHSISVRPFPACEGSFCMFVANSSTVLECGLKQCTKVLGRHSTCSCCPACSSVPHCLNCLGLITGSGYVMDAMFGSLQTFKIPIPQGVIQRQHPDKGSMPLCQHVPVLRQLFKSLGRAYADQSWLLCSAPISGSTAAQDPAGLKRTDCCSTGQEAVLLHSQ